MSTAAPSKPARDPFFDEWLPTVFVGVAVSRKHGHWYAVAQDFNIAGTGASESQAVEDVSRLVHLYLRGCFEAGESYEQARRPIPLVLRLRNAVASGVGRLLRGARPPALPREGRLALTRITQDPLGHS